MNQAITRAKELNAGESYTNLHILFEKIDSNNLN